MRVAPQKLKRRRLIGAALAAICVVWPNLVLIHFAGGGLDLAGRTAVLLVGVAGLALVLAVSGSVRAAWWANLPFVLLSPVFSGFLVAYREPPQSGMWASLFGTNLWESLDESRANPELIYAALAVYVLYFVARLLLAAPTPRLSPRSRVTLLTGAIIVVVGCYGEISLPWTYPDLRYIQPISKDVFYGTFPTGTALVAANFVLRRPTQIVAAPPKIVLENRRERQIFVFVVGETVQYFRWHDVATQIHSPLLTDPDTIVMRNNVSQAPLTMWSLPLLLSGDARESDGNPSWIDFANAAGFKTAWLNSNNFDDSRWEKKSDVVRNVDRTMVSKNGYDADLLPELDALLEGHDQKICIVLHVMGGHMSYLDRYPPGDALYPVDVAAYRAPASSGYHDATRAAYANAMAEDLAFVAAVEERLRAQQGAYAFMVYAPDHGENLFDDGTEVLQHGRSNPSIFELRVPIVIWGSTVFREQQAAGWHRLEQQVDEPTSSRQVLPTLLWAMGFHGAYTGARGLQRAPSAGDPDRFVATSFDRTVPLQEILNSKPDKTLCCAANN